MTGIACIGLLLALVSGELQAQSLSTTFVDLSVRDVEAGAPRLVEDKEGKGIFLQNTGREDLKVEIRILRPTRNELKPEYEPIPDISWITIRPKSFLIKGMSDAEPQVIVEVPKSRRYRGKLYQAAILIQSRSQSAANVQINAALKSNLLFQVKR